MSLGDGSLPLVDAGVTKADVAAFWSRQVFDLGIDSARGNCDCCYLKARPNLLATIRDEPDRADWWIAAERRAGRTFRRGESFEALRVAALAPNDTDEIGAYRGHGIGEIGEPLPFLYGLSWNRGQSCLRQSGGSDDGGA